MVVGEPRYLENGMRHGEAFVFGIQGGNGAPTAVPANTMAPAITGTVKAGSTLTGTPGTWSNNPSGYRYQWSRDGTPIQGATSSTYKVQTSDQGLKLTVAVTASNALGAGRRPRVPASWLRSRRSRAARLRPGSYLAQPWGSFTSE